MKKWRAAAALMLLAAPVAIYAQTVTQNGQSTRGSQQGTLMGGLSYADSVLVVPGVDPSSHGWYTADQSRDRDYVSTVQQVINVSNLAAAAADSNSGTTIDVHAYRFLMLYVKVHVRGGVGNVTRLAFQFREYLNNQADSMSVTPIYVEGQSLMGTSATGADTTNQGHLLVGTATAPWSGEYILTFNRVREGPTGTASTAFPFPNAVGLPLESLFGRPVRFHYLNVRIRNVIGPACDVVASIQGFAQ